MSTPEQGASTRAARRRGSWFGRRAVVTGAAQGIGRGFAEVLAAEGADLVLADLDLASLDELARQLVEQGAQVTTAQIDVGDLDAMMAWAERTLAAGPVHLLVNNAGVSLLGPVVDVHPAAWRRLIEVNLLGVVHGCHAFVPAMVAQEGQAAVINVASAAAFHGVPGVGVYAASKAAVLSLSQTMDAEIDPRRLSVHCLCPGQVPTGLLDAERRPGGALELDRRSALVLRRATRDVARVALRAVPRGQFLIPVYPEAHVAHWLRLLPVGMRRLLWRYVARRAAQETKR